MYWTSRRFCCSSLLLLLIAVGNSAPLFGAPPQLILSGVNLSSTNSAGVSNGNLWDTLPGPNPNLYLVPSSTITDPFQNTGDDSGTMDVNVLLGLGTFDFYIFAQPGVADTHSVLNLFFNFDDVNPGITSLGVLNSASQTPFGGTTFQLDGSNTVAGANSLYFDSLLYRTTLSSFVLYEPGVNYDLDRVDSFDSIPNGTSDFVGQFSLTVVDINTVPEPSTLAALAGMGVLLAAGWGWRVNSLK